LAAAQADRLATDPPARTFDGYARAAMIEPAFEPLRTALSARTPRRAPGDDTPQAAVALVLVAAGAGDFELLLIRRAERSGDPWSGHMALPGGRRDADDADLLATAMRETREEVAVALREAELIGELDDLRPVTAPARIVVRPFVFALRARPEIHASDEVADVLWASLRGLAATAGTTSVFHHGAQREMPCYRIAGHVVWGMTQRILEPFVEMISGFERRT
jgi:8-oxo-dGTP pyrophosphatase MutT (NUDIX family)